MEWIFLLGIKTVSFTIKISQKYYFNAGSCNYNRAVSVSVAPSQPGKCATTSLDRNLVVGASDMINVIIHVDPSQS